MNDVKKPFQGIRVIDLTTYLAAPVTCRLLAEQGADVIKIESFKGDPYRFYGSAMKVPVRRDENPVFDAFNGSKRSVVVDMKNEKGKEIFFKLLETADVLVTNNRYQARKKMGIDYSDIKDRFPNLIYTTISSYGTTGPNMNEPGFDSIAFFARTGLLTDNIMKGNPPAYAIPGGGDIMTGIIGYAATLTALFARTRTGKGDHVDVSLYGCGTWMTGLATLCAKFGEVYPKGRYELKPLNNNIYECKDGWITFQILEYERYYKKFFEVIGHPELGEDPRWQTRLDSLAHREELISAVEPILREITVEDAIARLKSVDIVASRLHYSKDTANDPQALENDYVRKVTCESGTVCDMFMNPIKSENIGNYEFRRGPHMGENTVEILSEIGYSSEEIDSMVTNSIVKLDDLEKGV